MRIFAPAAAFAAALFATSAFAQQEPDYGVIARSLVTQSAGVKPGDVVVLQSDEANLQLLKALVTATIDAGGLPVATLRLPTAEKAGYMAAPMDYLSQPPKADLAMLRAGDVFISATGTDDPSLYADMPEERISAFRHAQEAVNTAYATAKVRIVGVGQTGGVPTPGYAQGMGADYAALRAMFWSAMAVSPDVVAQRAAAVAAKMAPGSAMRLRTRAGTDLRFTLENQPGRASTGRVSDNAPSDGPAQAWLPAGEYYACVVPTSASGALVVPYVLFRGTPVINLRMRFVNGVATNISADSGGEAIKGYFDTAGADSNTLSLIDVGVNPEAKMLAGSPYRSYEMSGMVTAFLGEARWAGCTQSANGGFAAHIDAADLTAGRTRVVQAGALPAN